MDIEGSGAAQQCVNMSRTCSPFAQFWDFPANISDLGLSPLPRQKAARFEELYNKFEYWIEGERYELYTSNSSGSATALTDIPVWMGKVLGRHHMWHFEYVFDWKWLGKVLHELLEFIPLGFFWVTRSNVVEMLGSVTRYSKFAAGGPPDSVFDPPPGIVCQPSRSVASAADASPAIPLRAPLLSKLSRNDVASTFVFDNDPYLADMSHYEPDCQLDPSVTNGMICSQRAAPSAALRVGCVGDSITAVGHTSSKAHQYPSQLQDILDASYGNGASLFECFLSLSNSMDRNLLN